MYVADSLGLAYQQYDINKHLDHNEIIFIKGKTLYEFINLK